LQQSQALYRQGGAPCGGRYTEGVMHAVVFRTWWWTGVVLMWALVASGCDRHDHAHWKADPIAAAGDNPVQREMQLLTAALERAVRGIGMGDVRGVEHDLHQLHGAMESTEEAVRSGAYRLPKNASAVDRFLALDEAFHEELVALVGASRANDVPAAAEAVGTLVQRCDGCHREFRP
jgi:cytochrome c556